LWDCAYAYAGLSKIRTKAVILKDLAFCRGRRKQESLQNSDASAQPILSRRPDMITSEYPQKFEARQGDTTEGVRTKQDADVVMTDGGSKGASTTMVAIKPETFNADTTSPFQTSYVDAVAAEVMAALPDTQQDYKPIAQVVENKERGEQRSSDMADASSTTLVNRSTSPSKKSGPPKSIAHDLSGSSDEQTFMDALRTDRQPPGDAITFATDRPLDMAQSELAYSDVNSLLPGLESYANGNGDDIFNDTDYMANLSAINTRTRQDATLDRVSSITSGMPSLFQDATLSAGLGQSGTRFEDVFSFGDFNGEGSEQGGLDTQFDEDFFNLDNN